MFLNELKVTLWLSKFQELDQASLTLLTSLLSVPLKSDFHTKTNFHTERNHSYLPNAFKFEAKHT